MNPQELGGVGLTPAKAAGEDQLVGPPQVFLGEKGGQDDGQEEDLQKDHHLDPVGGGLPALVVALVHQGLGQAGLGLLRPMGDLFLGQAGGLGVRGQLVPEGLIQPGLVGLEDLLPVGGTQDEGQPVEEVVVLQLGLGVFLRVGEQGEQPVQKGLVHRLAGQFLAALPLQRDDFSHGQAAVGGANLCGDPKDGQPQEDGRGKDPQELLGENLFQFKAVQVKHGAPPLQRPGGRRPPGRRCLPPGRCG